MRNNLFKGILKLGPLILIFVFSNFSVQAQKEKLQTAFIFQVTRLVEWCPEGKQGDFVLGVLGEYPELMSELSALNGRKVAGQTVSVQAVSSIANLPKCNIVFVSDSGVNELKALNDKVKKQCTLIICDKWNAASRGAGISISMHEGIGKLQYEINKTYMESHSLNVNTQLYNMARSVY